MMRNDAALQMLDSLLLSKLSRLMTALVFSAALAASPASATILTVFDDFDGGVADFDATVTGAGSTVETDNWTGLASGGTLTDRGDYTIERIGGSSLSFSNYALYNSSPTRFTSGQVLSIDPFGSSPGIGGRPSGVRLTFDDAVNSIGFEVGDWGTCCQPSGLYISFDNGAPIQVGLSEAFGDVFLTNGGAGVFVAALDDSGSFSTVEFWGDGYGEVLNFGGTVRYATVGEGTLPGGAVPVPTAAALFGLGALLVGARRPRLERR